MLYRRLAPQNGLRPRAGVRVQLTYPFMTYQIALHLSRSQTAGSERRHPLMCVAQEPTCRTKRGVVYLSVCLSIWRSCLVSDLKTRLQKHCSAHFDVLSAILFLGSLWAVRVSSDLDTRLATKKARTGHGLAVRGSELPTPREVAGGGGDADGQLLETKTGDESDAIGVRSFSVLQRLTCMMMMCVCVCVPTPGGNVLQGVARGPLASMAGLASHAACARASTRASYISSRPGEQEARRRAARGER